MLRCFVAMAFGHDDTDAIYDGCIVRAVEDAGMVPIRVDRMIHTDRIDARIRAELANADVVVADLTYARPSVYWEAGYAERQGPVVYTCRRDHLHPREDDPHGNLRVHFDLANANIIAWTGAGDNAFSDRLRKTLLYASRPLRQHRAEEERIHTERTEFARGTPLEQRRSITDATLRCLTNLGFRDPPSSISARLHLVVQHYYYTRAVMLKRVGETLIVIGIMPCNNSLTRPDIELLDRPLYGFWVYPSVLQSENESLVKRLTRVNIRMVRRIILLPILASVPSGRVPKVLSSWGAPDEPLHYVRRNRNDPESVPRRHARTGRDISTTLEILVVDKIKSVLDYEQMLTQTINELEQHTPTVEDR